MVQSTFTKQKRELAKAANLLDKLRAQETRKIVFAPDGVERLEETKDSYVDFGARSNLCRCINVGSQSCS